MITDAQWEDLNNDGKLDLIVVGEFMEIHILLQERGKLSRVNLPSQIQGYGIA